MMFAVFLIFITLMGQICDSEICFRKYRGNGLCKGKMRKEYASASLCCDRRKAQGFAVEKMRFGKRQFQCVSCDELKRTTTQLPTTASVLPDWGEWSEWGDCTATCEPGFQTRTRNCTNGPGCSGLNFDVQSCLYCPVDGGWSSWGPWDDCSASCEGGTKERRRECNDPTPSSDGQDCVGESVQTTACNTQACIVDGGWSDWSRFSRCSVSCGDGEEYKTRQCNNPRAQNGGAECEGSAIHVVSCHRRACPIHGGWNTWSSWTDCTATCGSGVVERRRSCDRPRARYGGRQCEGFDVERKTCSVKRACPVDGSWSQWGRWGRCYARVPCGLGQQHRSRSCTNPRPRHRGRYCSGHGRESQECRENRQCSSNVVEV